LGAFQVGALWGFSFSLGVANAGQKKFHTLDKKHVYLLRFRDKLNSQGREKVPFSVACAKRARSGEGRRLALL